MKQIRFMILIFLIMLVLPMQSSAIVEHLYIEETSGYHRIDGETLRFEGKREFAIQDYNFYTNNDTEFVNITMVDDSHNGLAHVVTERIYKVNFIPTVEYLPNGSLFNVNWKFTHFRIPSAFSNPFENDVSNLFYDSELGHRRFDQLVESSYFSLALEHFEYHEIDGELVKLKVNTEFATDNNKDGRSYRTSFHIIKRTPDDRILYEYTYSFIEANRVYDLLNLIDQPILWVPVQLGSVFLLIYIYIRINRWWSNSGYKIVKIDKVGEDGEPIDTEDEKAV